MAPEWVSEKYFKLLKYEHIIYSFEARNLEIFRGWRGGGGCSHTRFNHNDVWPSLSARLSQSVVGQRFSDVLPYELHCAPGRWTFSVTLDMVLNLPLNLQAACWSSLQLKLRHYLILFDVFFMGLYSQSGRQGPLVKLTWPGTFTEVQSPGWNLREHRWSGELTKDKDL